MPYAELRAALSPGRFFVDNLWHLTRLGYALARSGEVRHPIIPLTIALSAERVASAWSGAPVENDAAQRVENLILPKLQALLELAAIDDVRVVNGAAVDALLTAYTADL